jgi:hypothetical protein
MDKELMPFSPIPPRPRPRFDAEGHLLGFMRDKGQLETDAESSVTICATAVGKEAVFEGSDPVGRISDVIFELESGEIIAYEYTDAIGEAFYLPAAVLASETRAQLRFPPQARNLAAHDLGGLGDTLKREAPGFADPDEFSIVEEFPEASE